MSPSPLPCILLISLCAGAAPLDITWGAPARLAITLQPSPVTASAGASATFTVAACGGAQPYTYQWSKDGQPLDDAIWATCVLPAVQPGDAGSYTVRVTDAFSVSVLSQPATLKVTPAQAPVILAQPVNATVAPGLSATFSVTASGANLLYQWHRDDQPIPGATAAAYVTPPTVAADNGARFSVRVSNAQGQVLSNSVRLTVTDRP